MASVFVDDEMEMVVIVREVFKEQVKVTLFPDKLYNLVGPISISGSNNDKIHTVIVESKYISSGLRP